MKPNQDGLILKLVHSGCIVKKDGTEILAQTNCGAILSATEAKGCILSLGKIPDIYTREFGYEIKSSGHWIRFIVEGQKCQNQIPTN